MRIKLKLVAAVTVVAFSAVGGGSTLADSPNSTISDESIQEAIDNGYFDPDCEYYRDAVNFLAAAVNSGELQMVSVGEFSAVHMMDYYTIQLAEQDTARSEGVPSASMTAEAKALLLGWLHTCGL